MENLNSALRALALGVLLAARHSSRAEPRGTAAYGIGSWTGSQGLSEHAAAWHPAPCPGCCLRPAPSPTRPDLVPTPGLIPYDLIVPFWSDGAVKTRYIAVPKGTQIGFSPDRENGLFRPASVFVKTFELPIDARIRNGGAGWKRGCWSATSSGGVYGVVYKWRRTIQDADLLPGPSVTETIPIRWPGWRYPSADVVLPKPRELPHLPQCPHSPECWA